MSVHCILISVTLAENSNHRGPDIVEWYREFEPTANFRQRIETLLKYVPEDYFRGLKTIVLANRSALTRDQRKKKVWSRNHKVRLADADGTYKRASKSSEAAVWLYVDNICSGESWLGRNLPLVRYMRLSDVLYHEIGHHIHTEYRPSHAEREDVAEDWSRKLWGRFVRKRYWYAFPVLYLFALLASVLARHAKWNRVRA